MCRRNLVLAAGLIGFGVGLLLSLAVESTLLRLIVGATAVCGGLALVRTKC